MKPVFLLRTDLGTPISPKVSKRRFLTMFDLHSTEYLARLEQYLQWYTEAARRLGNDGKRVGSDCIEWW